MACRMDERSDTGGRSEKDEEEEEERKSDMVSDNLRKSASWACLRTLGSEGLVSDTGGSLSLECESGGMVLSLLRAEKFRFRLGGIMVAYSWGKEKKQLNAV